MSTALGFASLAVAERSLRGGRSGRGRRALRSLPARWPLLALALLAGCQVQGVAPPPEGPRETAPEAPPDAKVVAECRVLEIDYLSREVVEERDRVQEEVRFRYGKPDETAAAIAAAKPAVLFVFAHGWQNDIPSSRDFTARLIKGILARAARDGVPVESLGFLAVHWDSKRLVFHESALNAEVIGRKRIAPFLGKLAATAPATKVVMVGHSLGGRLTLAALNASTGTIHGAVLLEAAADLDCLLPEKNHEAPGCFPLAPHRAKVLVNLHSQQDDVLRLAYANAMRSMAVGREGAVRGIDERFATVKLTRAGLGSGSLDAAFADALSAVPGATGARMVNVDATAVVVGHSEIFVDPVFDVIWAVARRS